MDGSEQIRQYKGIYVKWKGILSVLGMLGSVTEAFLSFVTLTLYKHINFSTSSTHVICEGHAGSYGLSLEENVQSISQKTYCFNLFVYVCPNSQNHYISAD